MTTRPGKSVYLQAITMIDPATGWIEIHTVLSSQAELVANQIELARLTCYPLTNIVIVDKGNEFLAKFREMIINDYGIMVKPITSRNLKLMQYWKECTKQLVIFYTLSKYKTWYWTTKTYGMVYWPPPCLS